MAEGKPATPKIKLIDYMANWCGPCRAMEPIWPELEKEFAGKVTFEKVDVDKEIEKSNAAGVMSLPTLHILKDDKVVQTLIGYQSKEDLAKYLNQTLATLQAGK